MIHFDDIRPTTMLCNPRQKWLPNSALDQFPSMRVANSVPAALRPATVNYGKIKIRLTEWQFG
jgi:hypothetical protein